jgi:hypothetical protein
MNEEKLKVFIAEQGIETNWLGEQLFAWLPLASIPDFIASNKSLFDDGPIENCDLCFDGTIAIDLTDICAYWEIDPERITPKKPWQ